MSLLHQDFLEAFPNLTATNHSITSPLDRQYNCIAWAAGESDVWWWPDSMFTLYWPDEAPRTVTLGAFIEAFATKGYAPCEDGHFENGLEKVAIYALNGVPTHAARQTNDGNWSSKLGTSYDVSHSLEALTGPKYGVAVQFLKRPLTSPTKSSTF